VPPERDPIVAGEPVPLYLLTVDERAEFAALIDEEVVVAFHRDIGVMPRDPGIREGEIASCAPPDRKRQAVNRHRSPIGAGGDHESWNNGFHSEVGVQMQRAWREPGVSS
jgi:hypothetical protein